MKYKCSFMAIISAFILFAASAGAQEVLFKVEKSAGQALIDAARRLQPDLIVNNRSGAQGDYDTPEQEVGKYQDSRPWETCIICWAPCLPPTWLGWPLPRGERA